MVNSWYHEVSADWLEARRTVLTATEAASLVPEMKRMYTSQGELKDDVSLACASLWAAKKSGSKGDTVSTGAAARGHVMEPYAVDDWNIQNNRQFHHWDDVIICSRGLGFSPDAMDVPMFGAECMMNADSKGNLISGIQVAKGPSEVMEIKSYEVANHMKAVLTDKMKHKELYQVATAFLVLPKLAYVRLLWYCPNAPISMHTEKYSRRDLHKQVADIEKVVKMYRSTVDKMENAKHPVMRATHTEEEVWSEHVKEKNNSSFL